VCLRVDFGPPGTDYAHEIKHLAISMIAVA